MTDGRCLCGDHRFRIGGDLVFMHHCHCGYCRKSQGSAYATLIGVEEKNLEWDAQGARISYQSSASISRSFCAQCGSPLPLAVPGMPVFVQAGLLDGDFGRSREARGSGWRTASSLYRSGWIRHRSRVRPRGTSGSRCTDFSRRESWQPAPAPGSCSSTSDGTLIGQASGSCRDPSGGFQAKSRLVPVTLRLSYVGRGLSGRSRQRHHGIHAL